jgi:hypothetical protein
METCILTVVMALLVSVAPLDIVVLNTKQGGKDLVTGPSVLPASPTCSGFCIGPISELEQSKTATYSKLRFFLRADYFAAREVP